MVGFKSNVFMHTQSEKNKFTRYLKVWDEKRTTQLKPEPKRVSDKWADEDASTNKKDKPHIELNNDVILKFLYEYVNDHFNQFGHYVPIGDKFESWWHHHKYGTSYQPIVQMCYIRKGQELGFAVREHHSQPNITKLAWDLHQMKYDRDTKNKAYEKIDVCWGDDEGSFASDNLTLALEYEDSGKIDELFEELYKHNGLLDINSKFTVLGTRLNYEPDVIIKKIEEKLKKDNITKPLVFIFIAPDSLTSKICFSEYVYQNSELKRIDNNKYFINIVSKNTPDGIIIEKVK